MPQKERTRYEKIVDLCLRRAMVYSTAEIYHPLAGFYEYGSVGSEIKRRFEDFWREWAFSLFDNVHEVQGCVILPEPVFRGSGHLAHFVDPIVKCKKCGYVERADKLVEEELGENVEGKSPEELNQLIRMHKIKCPKCHSDLEPVGAFQLMFQLGVGPTGEKHTAYLRPETAQTPYLNFKREFRANREKLPLGLCVIGKAFRNEISPRQLLLRMREFSQAELQIFFDPDKIREHPSFDEVRDYELIVKRTSDAEARRVRAGDVDLPAFIVYHMARVQQFYESLGLLDSFRFRELSEEEKAFYNRYHFDVEIFFPSFGKWVEVAGVHYRTDHDLGGHSKESKEDLSVVVEGKRFVPHVLELSFGVDRNIFAILDSAYTDREGKTVLALPPRIAPWDVGVYPLVNKGGLPEKAREVYAFLKSMGYKAFYDAGGSIGRRYARADEVGIPFGITIDFQTLEDGTVTVRDRDTTRQERVPIDKVCGRVWELKNSWKPAEGGQ